MVLPLDETDEGRAYSFVGMARPTAFMEMMEREWPGTSVRGFDRVLRSVQGSRFKYMWASDGERRLYDTLLDPESGTYLALEQLRERFEASGAMEAERAINYCGGGISATMTALALVLLGHPNVAVYDGSMSEYTTDPSVEMDRRVNLD